MAEHITEEEQLEALKRWWKENGTSLMIGVLLAVGGYFGWNTWQGQVQQSREVASALYDDMMEAGIVDPGQQRTDEQRSKVNSIAEELMSEYSGGLYAHNAAMLLAKIAVEDGELNKAEERLRWVLTDGPSDTVAAIVNSRLAAVLFAQDRLDEALQIVSTAPDSSFTANYAELRGDILVAKNQLADAETAYQSALDNLLQSQNSRRDMIQMKLDDVRSSLPKSAEGPSTSTEMNEASTEDAAEKSSEQTVEQTIEEPEGQNE